MLLTTFAPHRAFAVVPAATPKPTPPVVVPIGGTLPPGSRNVQTVTFGIRPSQAKAVDQRPFFTLVATPQTSIPDHVAVVNYSVHPLPLTIYAADATTDKDGGLGLLNANQRSLDAGSWITVQAPPGQLTVPARSSVIVPILVSVPQSASPGDHVAGVIASLNTLGKNAKGENVELQQRIATRVYIRVSGPAHPSLAVTDVHVRYRGTSNPIGAGRAEVTWTVRNTGNIVLTGHQLVTVNGWFGASAKLQVKDLPDLLLPGGSAHQSAVVTGVYPTFRIKAIVTVDPLHLPDPSLGQLPLYTGSASAWAIPWALLLILVALVLLGFAIRWWRKRRRRMVRNRPAPQVGAAPDLVTAP